ncbi:hypothetical protein OO013_05740 [Mangrovivirga sp. M17]|uniref:Uncharacterized protein n=1 Tax=Mangrovivirga halotolerans TaxID=2993936 RepID=A0ABT3RNH8_9BACT|nr:hypothetical protein [Mangrovivirga halotolerans]MCX2743357.1 hypothetical protein [Mangrovivirga halotolerans]
MKITIIPYLIILLIAYGCNSKTENQSIKNQILLNEDRNNQSLELLRTVVHESGDRKRDLQTLSEAENIFELRNNLKIDKLNLDYHKRNNFEHISIYLDSISSKLDSKKTHNLEHIKLANELLESSKKEEHLFYHLMLQTSYLETLFIKQYSQFCIGDLKYD